MTMQYDVRQADTQQHSVDIALLGEKLIQMDGKLDSVLEQTTKTNGRVNTLEAWRDRMLGAWFVISFAGPVITGLLITQLT